MKPATKRSILRWIHLVIAIPILGYIYSPFAELPNYAAVVPDKSDRLNMLSEETIHQRQSERNEAPKIQFS